MRISVAHKYMQLFRLFIVVMALSLIITAQEYRPLSLNGVVKLLEDGVPEKEIIGHVKRYKVDFVLEVTSYEQLFKAGAGKDLITAIRENLFSPLYITFPENNDDVSSFFTVKGWSKRISGKYLWLFTRQEGLSDWLPQAGKVELEINGEWEKDVYLRRERDNDINFDIKAVWVDKKSHEYLEKYIQLWDIARKKFPEGCPGIRPPEGAPTAQVKVRRGR
jgi:hypothetical protein